MRIEVLSSKDYTNVDKNCGDCFIIDNGSEVVVYDCGCEEHAQRVIEYLDTRNIAKAKIVLSHNDKDHYDGIPKLREEQRIEEVHTTLLLKHVDELLKAIGDGRKTRDSIKAQIKEIYSNIAELSYCNLNDAVVGNCICDGVKVIGPNKDYMIKAVAKGLDTREGDTIDKETIVNATSIQLCVDMGQDKMLLCGDSSFEAIKDIIGDYGIIQLPHHGKTEQANSIFDARYGNNNVVYIVSDNTGNSNGGSDNLDTSGHIVKNTKTGDIFLEGNTFSRIARGCYGTN